MHGRRVLLVEDDFILNLNLREILQARGLNVEAVYCAAAAFEAIDRDRPLGALVSDIDLGPGLDGLSVARRARNAYPGLPVVFMSATVAASETARDVPGSIFVAKPFDPAEILAALGREFHPKAA